MQDKSKLFIIKKVINANNKFDVSGTLKNIFNQNPGELNKVLEEFLSFESI